MESKCFDTDVKFYQILNESTDVLHSVGKCISLDIPNIYAEFQDGTKVEVTAKLKPKTNYNFANVSDDDKELIKKYVKENNDLEILKIHNKYLFCGYVVCCEVDKVKENFKVAIKEKMI